MYQFTLQLWQIGAILGASSLYALLISWEPILAIDDDREWRWLITAVGIAIVVALATCTGPKNMLDMFAAFAVSAAPIWVRATVFRLRAQRVQAIQQARNGTQTAPTA